ncbi:sensor histidine kinase [uncultured Tissierella sp.]|uniref:sensor histidine kinase n=1 Tax=uncultured Tissierella sp. TaxID=448160 RepID=UPI002804D9E2|nr:sensor histidine kinase [uncultured Tissierella sp.]MDU5082452.1 sensor histidine kinase [Bacillota bacterium]
MKINRIKLKIILLIFTTLIPLSILKITEIKRGVEASIETELEVCQDYAEAINLAFMNFIERTWSSQYILGRSLIAHPERGSEYIEDHLKSIVSDNQLFKIHYYWSTPEGIVNISSHEKDMMIDISGRNSYKEIISGKEKVIGGLEYSAVNGELIISISRAIRDDGELKGIVINTIEAKDMKYIFPINRIGAGSTFGLVDRDGNIVYQLVGDNVQVEKRKAGEDSPARRALKGEIVKTRSRYSEQDGVERMGVDYPIKEIGWSSFVTTPVEQVLASGRQLSIKNILIFVLIYIISFSIAMMLSSGFAESIDKLKLAAQKVKAGDLNVKTGISEEDDLGDVGQAFDSMVEALDIKAKEEEEYNNLKSEFLTTISHEFKTPLNIILGSIQLLESSDITNHEEFYGIFNKYIKLQKQNSYRLLRLINNFIDINKIEDNHIKIKLCNNDIVKVVEDITMSIVEYTKLKDISIIFDTDVEEKIIAFDADMVERIMLNLLSNSIKFTERGGEIEVNIYNEEAKVKISVKDNGIGIPEDKLEMIFDRFGQVENSLRRRTEGSGIGLSLVKSLVELHEGTISVQSEFGRGTEFIIELPDKIIDNDFIAKNEENTFNAERIHVEFSDIYV